MSSSTLPTTMQAWQKPPSETPTKPVRNLISVPSPGSHEVLLKILAAGVCHSDSLILETPRTINIHKEPFTLGHEACGEVISWGKDVHESKFRIGQRVAIHIVPGCQETDCRECSKGLQRLCQRMGMYGLKQPGFFASYAVVKDWAVVPVPGVVSSPVAAVATDAVLTAYHAVKAEARIGPGMTVVVYGLGGLGLNAVQIALHLGAERVLVVDKKRTAVDQGIKLGIAEKNAFCLDEGRKVEEVVTAEGIHVDATIDFVSTGETFLSAQQAVCYGGTMVMVGLIGQSLTYVPLLGVSKALKVLGSFGGTAEELEEVLDLIAQGKINPQVTTHPIEELPRVLEDMDNGRLIGRAVLLP